MQSRSPASGEAEFHQGLAMDVTGSNLTNLSSLLLPKTESKSQRFLPGTKLLQASCAAAFLGYEWFWDLMSLLASAGVLVAVVRICDHYNGKPQPDWGSISLKTGIAWLSAVSKLLLLMPLAKSMGQLKWIWMAQETRALSDLEIFDSSSRGIIGSVRVLQKTKGL